MRSPQRLFKLYLEKFPKIGIRWEDDSWTVWTKSNLQYFQKLGRSMGYECCYPDKKKGTPEYLVDLCLKHDKYKNWMGLALEQEWHGNLKGKQWDFQKLVYFKALLKVFIFYLKRNHQNEWPETREKWAKFISRQKVTQSPKERYLIISFLRERNRGLRIEGFEDTYDGFRSLGSKLFPDGGRANQ